MNKAAMAVVDEEKQIMSILNKRPLTKPAVYYIQAYTQKPRKFSHKTES